MLCNLINSQLTLNYGAHAWYLFESLEESTSMYNENYSEHLRNYGELQRDHIMNTNKFVLIQEI
ncbi:hypothetical protein T12_9597 [Trichinella patagoniensis]|uniref:Uncharacterized protein n=1 Tax=Trichinella patagoniensis TaxID=990121 RepID=A0A0V1A0M3_9BILA|nr:hypothetical protein T12_9597 [Trichinella patagoniensis]